MKNTTQISHLCHQADEPIFVTQNGDSDMVIMSAKVYEKAVLLQDVFLKIEEAQSDMDHHKTMDAKDATAELRRKYAQAKLP